MAGSCCLRGADSIRRATAPDDLDPPPGKRSVSRLIAAFAFLGLTLLASTAPGRAQAPPLGTLAGFAILAGSGITNTGNSVITGTPGFPGDLGSSTATIGGFPPGIVVPPGIIHSINDGPTITAQNTLTTAYNNLMGRPATLDLTGQDLGEKRSPRASTTSARLRN